MTIQAMSSPAPPLPSQYGSAQALEEYLGDPMEPDSVISFARAVELDEREEYPSLQCAALDRFGLAHHYVPAAQGGALCSFEELAALLRVIARRDLTVAVAHCKTLLGAISVWLAGSTEQQAAVAEIVRGGRQVALALTEREHGGDLLANDAAAVREDGSWLLSGDKWLINNATRGAALTVLARTDPAGGRRGFSLFLVDKAKVDPRCYQQLPKIKTHGIRGADISGIRFARCRLRADSLVGPLGGGLEVLLNGFQITRTLIGAFSLGAADTALRTTLDFARSCRRYGDTVLAIPHARQTLVDAFLDLLICDSLTLVGTRGLQAATEQSSLGSAAVKYYVTATLERTVHDLAVVLGARHYLREGHAWGIFQKLLRDGAILSVFDGSTVVNLGAIVLEIGPLARNLAPRAAGADPDASDRLRATCCLDAPLPAFDPGRLRLANRGRDDLLQGLAGVPPLLRRLSAEGEVDPAVAAALGVQVGALVELVALYAQQPDERTPGGRRGERSAAAFARADGLCRLRAGAAAVQVWLHNRRRLGEFHARGAWLTLALERLLASLLRRPAVSDPALADEMVRELIRRSEQGLLFAIAPLPLAGAGARTRKESP